MANHGPTPTERSYLAGYLDGEGCLSFVKRCPRVHVTSSFPGVLYRLQRAFGGRVSARKTPRGQKQLFEWCVYAADAIQLCYWLENFFHEKRDQCVCLIEAWAVEPKERDPFIKRCRELKHIDHGEG